jgi:hypothetical protein
MRLAFSLTGLALAMTLSAVPASAFDLGKKWDPTVAPEGYGQHKTIHHWIYRPHYKHVYHSALNEDPYAYRYARRAYYPHHASGYWVPAEQMRYRYRYSFQGPKFQYHPAWGHGKTAHAHDGSGDGKPTK